MCYLVAKKFKGEGSIAIQMEADDKTASLSTYLSLATLKKGVQIITLNNPNAYGEYAPYEFINSEIEFINKTLQM